MPSPLEPQPGGTAKLAPGKLTEERLECLIRWYDMTVFTAANWLRHRDDLQYFHENDLIKPIYERGSNSHAKGFVLTVKAEELVRRRAGLRLVNELLSRVNRTMSMADLERIISRVRFRELPVLLACGDSLIRDLAARRMRKREFFQRM